jgi:hypothetical protein
VLFNPINTYPKLPDGSHWEWINYPLGFIYKKYHMTNTCHFSWMTILSCLTLQKLCSKKQIVFFVLSFCYCCSVVTGQFIIDPVIAVLLLSDVWRNLSICMLDHFELLLLQKPRRQEVVSIVLKLLRTDILLFWCLHESLWKKVVEKCCNRSFSSWCLLSLLVLHVGGTSVTFSRALFRLYEFCSNW